MAWIDPRKATKLLSFLHALALFQACYYRGLPISTNNHLGYKKELTELCRKLGYREHTLKNKTFQQNEAQFNLICRKLELNISIFSIRGPDGHPTELMFPTGSHYNSANRVARLLTFGNYEYFGFVRDYALFSHLYKCDCDEVFATCAGLTQHRNYCVPGKPITELCFKVGPIVPKLHILRQLESMGITKFSIDQVSMKYCAFFDAESLLLKMNHENFFVPDNLMDVHQPVLVGVCSNHPNFGFKYFEKKDENDYSFIGAFINHLFLMQKWLCHENMLHLAPVLRYLRRKCEKAKNRNDWKVLKNIFVRIKASAKKLVVVGFNSGGYDLSLLRNASLFFYLRKAEMKYMMELDPTLTKKKLNSAKYAPKILSCLKKGKRYLSLSTGRLLFLDQLNWLSPMPLTRFISTFGGGAVPKSTFPYFCAKTLSDLHTIKVVDLSKDSFWNPSRLCNLLDENYAFNKLIDRGETSENAAKKLRLKKIPKTIQEKFQEFLNFCSLHSCVTLFDALKAYLVPDVESFAKAAVNYRNNMMQLFNVDMWNYVSVSSFAFSTLLSTANTSFDHTTFDCFYSLSESAFKRIGMNASIGGLSTILQWRIAYQGGPINPRLNKNPFKIEKLSSLDANALYSTMLAKLSHSFGPYVTRHKVNDFAPGKILGVSRGALAYFAFFEWRQGLDPGTIRTATHRFGEVKFVYKGTRFAVDGAMPVWSDEGKIEAWHVMEYMGCRFHPCDLCQTQFVGTADERKAKEKADKKRLKRLLKIERILTVTVTRECELKKYMELDEDCREFIKKFEIGPPMVQKKFTNEELIKAIVEEKVVGFVDCSEISVPSDFETVQKFSLFPPVFCHTEIGLDELTPREREMADDRKIFRATEKKELLVNEMSATNICVHTALLKCYAELGLNIEIDTVYQFDKVELFKDHMEHLEAIRTSAFERNDLVTDSGAKLCANSSFGVRDLN